MKRMYLCGALIILFGLIAGCFENLTGNNNTGNSAKKYKGTVVVKNEVHKYSYMDEYGYAHYTWVTSSAKSYNFECDSNDTANIDFPAVLTISDIGNNKIKVVFNLKDSNLNGIKDLTVEVGIDGMVYWSGTQGDSTGRTSIGVAISQK
jgi:hypothetical protein